MNGYKWLGNIFRGEDVPLSFDDLWNQVTPENPGKWGEVEVNFKEYNWTPLDAAYNHAKAMGYPFKQHTFIWGNQQPKWIGDLSQKQQLQAVGDWMREYGLRYPQTDFIDVVNEPINLPPPFKMALGGGDKRYGTGWDWVICSFELAKRYNPNARLLINEHKIICSKSNINIYKDLIEALQKRDLIDGIGIQCHSFNISDMSEKQITQNLNSLAETGLPLYISELDIEGNDTQQLELYKKIFPVLWEHHSVRGITLWGYIQNSIWVAGSYLMTGEGDSRPALDWLMEYLKEFEIYLSKSDKG